MTREQFEQILSALHTGLEDEALGLRPLAERPGCWSFSYSNPEVNYGSFSVERFLTTEKLPFDRLHEGSGVEFCAGRACYRPALDRIFELTTDGEEPTLCRSRVHALIAQTETREGLIAELHEALGEGIPPLPPLELDFDPYEEPHRLPFDFNPFEEARPSTK